MEYKCHVSRIALKKHDLLVYILHVLACRRMDSVVIQYVKITVQAMKAKQF